MKYEDIHEGIATWSGNGGEFDVVGVLHFVSAAAARLAASGAEVEFEPESVVEIFDESQIQVLMKIARAFHAAG